MQQGQVQRYNYFSLVLKFSCFNIDLFQSDFYENLFQYIYLIFVFRICRICLGVWFCNFFYFAFMLFHSNAVECLSRARNINLLQLGFFVLYVFCRRFPVTFIDFFLLQSVGVQHLAFRGNQLYNLYNGHLSPGVQPSQTYFTRT